MMTNVEAKQKIGEIDVVEFLKIGKSVKVAGLVCSAVEIQSGDSEVETHTLMLVPCVSIPSLKTCLEEGQDTRIQRFYNIRGGARYNCGCVYCEELREKFDKGELTYEGNSKEEEF